LKKIILSVSNDLHSDQRVHRVAQTLHDAGLSVHVVGRMRKNSPAMPERDYTFHRIKLIFDKGFWFYAELNFRLFFYLLFKRSDLLLANDLDTLLPNFLTAKIKRSQLFYDSHEYFTEVPELTSRPRVQRVWKRIEQFILPSLKHMYTVNNSIAKLYQDEYKIEVGVVRNVPFRNAAAILNRADLGLPEDKKIVIVQGAGINIDRGTEEAMEAILYVDNAILLIAGSGDVIPFLKNRASSPEFEGKVIFLDRQPYDKLMAYTSCSDLGLSLDKDTNLNYKYSLPNKLFDYIQAGIPVLASDLIEVKNIVLKYDVGMIATSHDPKYLAKKIHDLLDEGTSIRFRENSKLAARELCWENERKTLLSIFGLSSNQNS
jgi:glycosyltransferase involved in cell wall biosynthesis